ncbi:hypothetical protein RJ639_024170 [Escallonia herrerae]|uniref:Uncharacterized protein n=1 Tax=Escallonia herrerae TaxID=1293975 RepID=A0AA89ACI7_9ASTE|nr:hypothetical protein RJ639_024170 [Escallonia herrerae]
MHGPTPKFAGTSFQGIADIAITNFNVISVHFPFAGHASEATGHLPAPHTPISNLDLLSGRFPVTYFYFYKAPPVDDFTSTIESLKSSLAASLTDFYPFAARIVQDPKTSEPEIVCDNSGAVLVEANANIPLKELNFYNLDQSLKGKLVTIEPDFATQIQVTRYTCGGLLITFTFDHTLGDASAFSKFLLTWSEIATKKPISCLPDHRRGLRAQFPPTYDPTLDQVFVSCTLQDIVHMPTINFMVKRPYYVAVSNIDQLQRLACTYAHERTKIEAFSAILWKIMVRIIDETHTTCNMAFGEASVVEVKQGSISDVATMVHDAISKITNATHFLDLIDWIECHRPGMMLSKLVLGRGGPAVVVSSGRRFPVSELDFGFGSPVLGTVCSTIEKIGVGYINQRQSAKGDDSWVVSAILWPELVAALESDPEHVFQPVEASHLQL